MVCVCVLGSQGRKTKYKFGNDLCPLQIDVTYWELY